MPGVVKCWALASGRTETGYGTLDGKSLELEYCAEHDILGAGKVGRARDKLR